MRCAIARFAAAALNEYARLRQQCASGGKFEIALHQRGTDAHAGCGVASNAHTGFNTCAPWVFYFQSLRFRRSAAHMQGKR